MRAPKWMVLFWRGEEVGMGIRLWDGFSNTLGLLYTHSALLCSNHRAVQRKKEGYCFASQVVDYLNLHFHQNVPHYVFEQLV